LNGAFVDGSGWRAVYDILKRDGYQSLFDNPVISLYPGTLVSMRILLGFEDREGMQLVCDRVHTHRLFSRARLCRLVLSLAACRNSRAVSDLLAALRWPEGEAVLGIILNARFEKMKHCLCTFFLSS